MVVLYNNKKPDFFCCDPNACPGDRCDIGILQAPRLWFRCVAFPTDPIQIVILSRVVGLI